MSTEADALLRLGEPRQVADAAVDTYRRRSLVGRYSAVTFLVFAVSPILSLVVFAAVGLLVMFAAARGLGFVDDSGTHLGTSAKAVLPYLVTALTIVIPSATLTALYFGLAKRSGIGRRWTIVSCVVLSVLAGLAMCDVQLSDLPGQSRLTFGLGVGFEPGPPWTLVPGPLSPGRRSVAPPTKSCTPPGRGSRRGSGPDVTTITDRSLSYRLWPSLCQRGPIVAILDHAEGRLGEDFIDDRLARAET